MSKMRTILQINNIFILFILISCKENKVNECLVQSNIKEKIADITIERLETRLANVPNKKSLQDFIENNSIVSKYFFGREDFPNDSVMLDFLFKKYNNPHFDTLMMEVNRVFGDLTPLEKELEQAFANMKYYYPEFKIPKVKSIVTGFDYDLFISDSLIVIGLDYYLGENARYRPLGLYQYILKRYAPQYIVPSIMLLYGISSNYNKSDLTNKTILADMISYGKAYYFSKRMMPCTQDSVLIWYSKKEIEGCLENNQIIWTHFVENKLFYETSHLIKKKYIEDRPKTYEIGDEAPGRIGTWLGWQIVSRYMEENPKITLKQMMENQDVQQIFKESRYKP